MPHTTSSQLSHEIQKPYKFSYTSEHDSWFKRAVIGTVEIITGRKYMQRLYEEIMNDSPDAWNVWGKALKKLNVSLDYDEKQLEKTPASGPVIFIANHPFGILDGLIFVYLATKMRKDYFLLINEVVSDEPTVKEHFLPVDFRPTEDAKQTNLNTRAEATERLRNGETMIIFPSGGVATARTVFGEPEEFPWRKFICSRIHETKATVVPLFFHGKNSPIFHLVSGISMDFRVGMLLHETMNKRGRTIKIDIGDPIPYSQMEPYRNRQELIDFLYNTTMGLGKIDEQM